MLTRRVVSIGEEDQFESHQGNSESESLSRTHKLIVKCSMDSSAFLELINHDGPEDQESEDDFLFVAFDSGHIEPVLDDGDDHGTG